MNEKPKLILIEATLDELGQKVQWAGDSLGIDDEEYICIRDSENRECYATPSELLAHPVWARLDDYSRRRINGGLQASEQVKKWKIERNTETIQACGNS